MGVSLFLESKGLTEESVIDSRTESWVFRRCWLDEKQEAEEEEEEDGVSGWMDGWMDGALVQAPPVLWVSRLNLEVGGMDSPMRGQPLIESILSTAPACRQRGLSPSMPPMPSMPIPVLLQAFFFPAAKAPT
jgi:hypothetical protein